MDLALQYSLKAGAARLGVPLDDKACAQFSRYLELLLQWNRRIKLTSVTEPGEVVDKHFLDSLAILPELDGAASLVDVGSGPGFPGVPAAVLRPELPVTVVESILKKASFLEALKRELRLPNLTVYPGRMEALVNEERTFAVAVSRATFAPPEWIVRAVPLVGSRGRVIAMVVPGGVASPSAESPTDALAADALLPGWAQHFSFARFRAYAPGRALVVLDCNTETVPGPT